MTNEWLWDEWYVTDISVLSGTRGYGKSVDYSQKGRRTSGFLYILSGEVTFFQEGVPLLTASDGELIYLPCAKPYSVRYTAEHTVFALVNFDLYGNDRSRVLLFDGVTAVAKEDSPGMIAGIMTKFELCGSTKHPRAILRKRELIYRLLGFVCATNPHVMINEGIDLRILDGVRLLEQSYLENLEVEEFAAVSHVSVSTFRKLFGAQFGMSPVKYRNRLRIERARELLRDGTLNVAEVAYACGFDSVGYFCRYYRKTVGESPGETRKQILGDRS